MKKTKNKLYLMIINIVVLCVLIGSISAFFVYNQKMIGFVLIILGIITLFSLKLFKIKMNSLWPDIIFGVIDNGILAVITLVSASLAGVFGAIIGGVVGNSITDGIAGIFEGYTAEKLRIKKINESRTILSAAVGKMAGCLFGAGIVLILAYLLKP